MGFEKIEQMSESRRPGAMLSIQLCVRGIATHGAISRLNRRLNAVYETMWIGISWKRQNAFPEVNSIMKETG